MLHTYPTSTHTHVMHSVDSIREYFCDALHHEDFVVDKTGVKTVEMIGAQFVADEPLIFGSLNHDYIERELEWYKSMDLNVFGIKGKVPEIWKQVCDENGYIHSNYGWCVWSDDNGRQYEHVRSELVKNPNSRRAVMIYTRPAMHQIYNINGMSDFMCTNTVQYFIRENVLTAYVSMRSNDVWAGYRNDLAWQKYVLEELGREIGIETGDIIWNVGSLHLYEKDFWRVDSYIRYGHENLTKTQYLDRLSKA